MGLIDKLQTASRNTTSYRVGLLQTKAYRILKQQTSKALSESNISIVEWALLGVLYDEKKGMRLAVIAKHLGVEAPFITQMLSELKKTKFISFKQDPDDVRAKIAELTTEGQLFVKNTESIVRSSMKPLLKDVSIRDILGYITVLEKIIYNSEPHE